MNMLGVDSPSSLNRTFSTPGTTPRNQPSTPTVVPPTPSPAQGSSSSKIPVSSPSSSSHELFFDAVEDNERANNRRSMYRSPGTSSSPDLATLLRKAKGGVVPPHLKKEKRRESPPPLPPPHDRPSTGTRQRSSTSYSSNQGSSAPSSPAQHDRIKVSKGDNDRTLPSPRPTKENGTMKVPKSTVRSKTSAFWGKMLGQSTLRERSKTDAVSYSTPNTPTYLPNSLENTFTPPVPPLPSEHHQLPVRSPIADVFSSSPRPPDQTKPLPPIMSSPAMRESDDADERSMVFIDKVPLFAPPDVPAKAAEIPDIGTVKRRSMSVGDVDSKKSSTSVVTTSQTDVGQLKLEGQWDDSTLHGILDDFKVKISTSPTTSTREFTSPPASPPQLEPEATLPAIVPPRSSSLQTPVRPTIAGSSRSNRQSTSPLMSRIGAPSNSTPQSPRDTNRLRVLHRSSASSSEPSLVPIGDDTRILSAPRRSSQQDLSVNDLGLSRFPSTISSATGDETGDMDVRGKELASRCWNEDEEFLAKEKIAEWLGGHGRINKVALRHYIDFFDFTSLRLDLAFRRLCAKLFLKGETQQVDRILEEFSRRYWDCNPGGLYGSANIVHAVAYSLLLLNTDLHVAELTTRMSRNQFVRNTLTAIQTQLQPASPVGALSSTDLTYDDCSSSLRGTVSEDTETISRSKRSDSIASWNSISREVVSPLPVSPAASQVNSLGAQLPNGSTPSVQISAAGHEHRGSASHQVYGRAWENDMESLLREMYNAIKSQQILQPLNSSFARPSTSSLSPGGPGMTRNRSLRGQPDRLATLKRGSIRGLQSILSAQSSISPYSSNSSIDGRASPSPSFATSTHEALYGSSSSFLTPTLGFASNLSHTIIREAQEDDDRSIHSEGSTSTTISITDEELALLGAPWAKEGMLCRKQYWESTGKRARDKAWLDVFVVIQKGELNMFIFGDHTSGGSGTFGGGNWLANAHPVGTVHLAHSLAHSLPPPGYNRQRPYCMVLTLANGGVYFFQAGTEELVNEWVSTCNYWAARTSKEPLAGGVSNMEYGWNRVDDPYSHGRSQSNNESGKDADQSDGLSVRSGRSARSKFGWREGAATVRATNSPWGDKTFINDWKPPLPPTMSSVHDEETQLEALRKHVKSMKKDLEVHNYLREPMAALYQPRTANAMKAQSNWEKKSQYLLTEIVKYDSYIDSLQSAMTLRLKKRGEKALEHALNGASPVDDLPAAARGKWRGPEEETIREEAEPVTPGPGPQQFSPQLHRRETAEDGTDE
ncbi:hypothetical protein BDQ12DRAFT_29737 [Crucibulum laeve]|uniref:SEC7 domain-containing protein n=1 Tax=Crucibulum laeve TaxID=68775 RepID=A0A5C3MGY5_9AGAR|nr:hypothetical protein BDQ12DRAFT_29737 [Crucibulum laeve]